MIDIKEANEGDFLYVKLSWQAAPVFAEIKKILYKENALELWTDTWGRRIVITDNAYWSEKEAKRNKIVKIEYNYKDWIKEMRDHEETETDNRIDTLHHGQSGNSENPREVQGTSGIQKSAKRKQKVVRKSSTKRCKPSGNRKTRSRKK
jgi:hypothetical protein